MRYLKYTQVDSVTGIPVTISPARNGPVPPAVAGLTFGFALESQYPTLTPTYYGTCPGASDTDIPGVLDELTEAEYQAAYDAEMRARVAKTIPVEVEGWQAEVAMRATPVDPDDPESQSAWDRVQDLIAAMPDGIEKITAQTVLARGKIRRDSPMLAQLAPLVPLSEERVDDLMRLAASIEA